MQTATSTTGRAGAHIRINTGLLAAAEKRLLIWTAQRLPSSINSDHLTLLALAGIASAAAAFWWSARWPPALFFVLPALAVNWFGDSLDGTLARVRRHERPRYGFYVDHVLDIFGTTLLVAGIVLSGCMTPMLGLAMLVVYLLVSAEVFLATAVSGAFRMSFLGVGPTELRIVLSAGALCAYRSPVVHPFGVGPFLLFDLGGLIATAGLGAAFLFSTLRTTAALYRAEPLPAARRDHAA